MRKIALALAATATLATAAPANAVAVNYGFGAAGTGTMTLDLTGGAYTLSSLNLTLGTGVYTTGNTGLDPISPPTYLLGGNLNGVGSVFGNTTDFLFQFNPSLSSQTVAASLASGGSISIQAVTITQVAAGGVPEPSTWAMMLLGFGAIGFAMRRRRVVSVALQY